MGVPVYELLGGKTREKVRVYASVMHLTEDNNELAKAVSAVAGNGLLQLQKSSATVRSAHQMEKGNFIPAVLNVK